LAIFASRGVPAVAGLAGGLFFFTCQGMHPGKARPPPPPAAQTYTCTHNTRERRREGGKGREGKRAAAKQSLRGCDLRDPAHAHTHVHKHKHIYTSMDTNTTNTRSQAAHGRAALANTQQHTDTQAHKHTHTHVQAQRHNTRTRTRQHAALQAAARIRSPELYPGGLGGGRVVVRGEGGSTC
jgi:hypothetical protein